MTETFQFRLPLVEAAQAQKHVTVNEALARLDAAAQLRLVSISITLPPASAVDGEAYFVPVGAVNAWDGHVGEVAVFANGGWVFLTPARGWSAWVEELEMAAVYDGVDWRPGGTVFSAAGAASFHRIIEFDHVITAGATNDTLVKVNDKMLLIGVTGRVLSQISGAGVTGWKLGIDTSPARFGTNHGLAKNTWINAMSFYAQTYPNNTPLTLEAIGGEFAAGSVRLAMHVFSMEPPRPV
ncbi:MAG: DUF2793 domain-containing protein [Rhodobacteraceae bacterium]|nr:DUF2793 domain-containing protein [Paracoccaceae bacterium]